MNRFKNFFIFLLLSTASISSAKTYELQSPDKTIQINVQAGQELTYSVLVDGQTILNPSPISMTLANASSSARVSKVKRRTVNQKIEPVVPEKFAVISDFCNEMTLVLKNNFSVIFRAYNNGVTWRFGTNFPNDVTVVSEQVNFNFSGTSQVYFPEEESFFSHNERTYLYCQLDTLAAGRLASLPTLVGTPGPKVLIAESGLRDYPGLWLRSTGQNALTGDFPHFPLKSQLRAKSDRDVPVTEYADFLAQTSGKRVFPWRILAIARNDGDLITNQLVYQLADELELEKTDWIQPGKVAWDWWNANNVYGVDFRAGVNTETYRHYIDFASRLGIEYIILDEGWYKLGNLLDVVPEMDVPALMAYGREKNVGIILWVIWKTLDDQLDEALDQFEKWGAAGIKVDFMQRDDQEMVNYYWKIAAEAAKRKLLVNFHGAYKPAGLRRAFPNVITREGVKGLEWNKWSSDITPAHNLTLPFIRMVSGPMDFTPGAMLNAQPKDFHAVFLRPMSQGTRAHQVAMYVIYESPLQMLADSPSNYSKETACAEFISQIPTTWEDTRVLAAQVGEFLVLARKHGENWYLGGMTNEAPREFTIELSFLEPGEFTAEILEDGINADRFGGDFRLTTRTVTPGDSLNLKLAPGGGCSVIFRLAGTR